MPANAAQGDTRLAEVVLPAGRLAETTSFFTDRLGFRLDGIMPADDPRLALISRAGLRLRLDADYHGDAGTIHLDTDASAPHEALIAPNGTRVVFGPSRPPMHLPALQPRLEIQRMGQRDAWNVGRAGMQYRDLIPSRQGGRFIASHIRIVDAGPVGDNVHYHDIQLQLIFCHRGWVRLVYEDQGEPFVMRAGDCVLQPPGIRHRVLESSAGLEVIEIGSPAEHMTWLDHQMTLPTTAFQPGRDFGGQRFVFHQADKASWQVQQESGLERCDLGIASATGGLGGAHLLRRPAGAAKTFSAQIRSRGFVFSFLRQAHMTLIVDDQPLELGSGDAFVIPAGTQQQFADLAEDWELLQVYSPG